MLGQRTVDRIVTCLESSWKLQILLALVVLAMWMGAERSW